MRFGLEIRRWWRLLYKAFGKIQYQGDERSDVKYGIALGQAFFFTISWLVERISVCFFHIAGNIHSASHE